jgi:hypothetical protein
MCYAYLHEEKLPGHPTAIRGTSGKVFPWAVPPWERRIPVLEGLWTAIKDRIYYFLMSNHLLYLNERLSGSESGQTVDLISSKSGNKSNVGSTSTGIIHEEWEWEDMPSNREKKRKEIEKKKKRKKKKGGTK